MATNQQQHTKGTEVSLFSIGFESFADSKIPEMKKQTWRKWVDFGNKNDYPDYLLMLLNKSAKHNAIINGKVTYIFGKGLAPETETPQADTFLNRANESQSWNELAKILIRDKVAFGGYYVQAIPKAGGVGYNYYHLSFDRVRTDESCTQFFYKKDWTKYGDPTPYPAFKPGIKEASVIFYKESRPQADPYPLPDYVAACNWIESDIEVSKGVLTNAKTGFSASKFINFYNGEPAKEKQASITKRLENAATGSEGKKLLVGFNNDPSKKPTVDDLGESDLTREDFTAVDDLITGNIYAGHGITTPQLFGVPQKAGLGDAGNSMKIGYTTFKNTYASAKQQEFETVINYIASVEGVQAKFKLVDLEEIFDNIQLSDFKDMLPKEFVYEKLGIDLSKYPVAPVPGVVSQQQSANTILTNLTAKQHQQVMRIVRQFTKQQLNDKQAILMLTSGYGMSEGEAKMMLGIEEEAAQFSKDFDENDVALMFSECGESRANFITISSKSYREDDDEFREVFKTATELTELESKVNDLIKKDSKITNKGISEALKLPIEKINTIVDKLLTDGIISEVSPQGIRKVLKDTPKSNLPDFKVMYSYEKRRDVTGPELLPSSRPFCVKMIGLDRFYSRKDIQNISQKLGYNVFNRAGGFWNHGGKTETQCRHEWRSHIVIKKK